MLLTTGSITALYAQQSNNDLSRFFDLGSHQVQRITTPEQNRMRARLLTASCAACHGTDGMSIGITPVLAGIDAKHFRNQMRDFAIGARPGTVMNHHARGYTPAEVSIMAEFFAAQSCQCERPTPLSDFAGGIGILEEKQP